VNDFWNVIAEFLKNFGTSVLESVALLLFGIIVIKLVARLLRAILKRTKVEGAAGSFIISIVQAALALILFFLIMDIFDIDTSSIITILAASGLAVGLALQDGLSNLASGVTILLTRPFKEKDHVKINDVEGIIRRIRLTTTEILTFDNVSILIPNKKVASSEIINYTNRPTRRVDIVISAPFESDPDTVKAALWELIKEEPSVLKTPAPSIILSEVAASAINYKVRMWVNTAHYWKVRNGFTEKVVRRFREKGIPLPYQKLSVIFAEKEGKDD
jgi:small conductance mechanosensitive channel